MKIEVSEETKNVIETLSGKSINDFLEHTKNEMLKNKTGEENRLSVDQVAKLMEASKQFVRIGLQQGIFPWGYAVKTSSQWTYYINRQKFIEHEGIKVEGNDKS